MRSVFFVLPFSCFFATVFPVAAQAQHGKAVGGNITDTKAISGLKKIGQLSSEVRESSGMAPGTEPGIFYTHGDSGNDPVIYKVTTDGKLVDKIKLPVSNNDWESMAHDGNGNLFICDCGNNDNDRKDLIIYSFRPETPEKVTQIKFHYPDQQKFPPKKKERNFDTEATIWHSNHIYLFSRDRGKKQTSKIYTVPATPGNHEAKQMATLNINGQVTSASLSPDGKKLALLTLDKIVLFSGNSIDELLKSTPKEILTTGAGQTEGSEFLDNNTLLISTEAGDLYKVEL